MYTFLFINSSDLSKNELNSINTKTFQQLKSLSKLSLSHNNLKSMFEISNKDLENLKELNLNDNKIKEIGKPNF